MPIYEFRCKACGRKNSVFLRSFSDECSPACSSCGSQELRRLVSLFSVVKSEESRLDDLTDPSSFGDLDENDPKSMARWARKMGSEMGEDLGPEFDEMVERMEAGESPDEPGSGDEGLV
ncbi:MAG: zinc ribbon domain-containing protein [Dehalococcoidia bacterium]|nr:zinc ribbon domain-containing protein [Dehalococcoidia bacterium]